MKLDRCCKLAERVWLAGTVERNERGVNSEDPRVKCGKDRSTHTLHTVEMERASGRKASQYLMSCTKQNKKNLRK